MPPLVKVQEYLDGIWEREWLTNQGPLLQELERGLKRYLNLPGECCGFANAGLAQQIALKALGVRGEVITTPFTYVATASCALWEGCKVKFADIEPESLTLDPKAIEATVSHRTEAIIATHVFGNACDVDALKLIGEKYGIPVIFDAAHAFGSKFKGRSLLENGSAAILSLHATKIVHSVEGGIVHTTDPVLAEKIEWMRRYGHNGFEKYHGVGINAKLSELHAAIGLCVLEDASKILVDRKRIAERYADIVSTKSKVRFAMKIRENVDWNASYFPVLFESEELLLESKSKMESRGISPRRYFYPGLNRVEELEAEAECPVSDQLASRVMVLPSFYGMNDEDMSRVVDCL